MKLLVAAFAITCALSVGHGQIPGQNSMLGNVQQVKVMIFSSNDELKKIDLSSDVLETDVELRLRKAGVPVLASDATWPKDYQPAVIMIIINHVNGDNLSAVEIKVELWRHIGSGVVISTWQRSGIGLFGSSVVRQGVRDAIADEVDRFANAYLETHATRQRK